MCANINNERVILETRMKTYHENPDYRQCKKFLTDQMDKYLPWWATTEIEAIQEAVTRKSYDHLPSYGEDDSWPLMKE